MNSGGEPVVVSTVVVGLEVVDVALKSLMISFKVLGFSEMYKDHQELKYQKMPKKLAKVTYLALGVYERVVPVHLVARQGQD